MAPTLLAAFAGASDSSSHVVTFDQASTPGKTIVAFVNSPALVSAPAGGWTWTRNALDSTEFGWLILPAASHTAPLSSVTVPISAGRSPAMVFFEDYIDSDTLAYTSFPASAISGGGTAWGTGLHTFTRDVGMAVFTTGVAGTLTGDITSYDNAYVELADTGASVTSFEQLRMWVATGGSMSSNGISATLSPASNGQSLMTFAGMVGYDVAAPAAALEVSPASVGLAQQPGTGTDAATVTVSASDASGAVVAQTDDAAWLTVTPASGAEPQVFTFTADATGLTAGQYTADVTFTSAGYADLVVPVTFDIVVPDSIAVENAKAGVAASIEPVNANGDVGFLGFTRQFSYDVGETVEFAVDDAGVGAGDSIDIYRFGYYGGDGKRLVATISNTLLTQSGGTTIVGGNSDTTMAAWTTTATWTVPLDMTSGMFVAAVRSNVSGNVGAWIPFVVRNDAVDADIVVKVNDSTWGAAYNFFGDKGSEKTGRNVYYTIGVGTIQSRGHAMSYDRPIVTRNSFPNHFDIMELPFIDWVEANGFSVKYIGCYDLDQEAVTPVIGNASVLVSVGHDEYWTQNMWDNAVAFRDAGGHLLWMSGNSVFWRSRYTDNGRVLWCFKDTMPGPGAHVAGDPLDPVEWTGTFRDLRRTPDAPVRESLLTGAVFRMNNPQGDLTLTIDAATYGSSPLWRDTTVQSGPTDLVVPEIVGFEADAFDPTDSGYAVLGDGEYLITTFSDNNGESYALTDTLRFKLGMFYATPTSGLTVSFGTTQWAWGLSDRHTSRGSAVANIQMRQAMLNLLYDLGLTAATKQSDLVTPTPVALSTYGVSHTGINPQDALDSSIWRTGSWEDWATETADANEYNLITRFTVNTPGSVQNVWYFKDDPADAPVVTVFLLNMDTQSILGQASVDWGTETGWVSGSLPSPVVLTTGVNYAAGVVVPASFNYTSMAHSFTAGPVVGTYVTASEGSYRNVGVVTTIGYATAPDDGAYFVDVEFVPGAGGTTALRVGDVTPTALKVGSTDVLRVYKGDTLVWGSPP